MTNYRCAIVRSRTFHSLNAPLTIRKLMLLFQMLHKRGDYGYYKPMVEETLPVHSPYQPNVLYFKYTDLVNYDVCLWKHIDNFIGREEQ